MKPNNVFKKLLKAYNDGADLIINQGGVASGKTWGTLHLLISIASWSKRPLTISVVSETMPHLKRGAMRDFFDIIGNTYKQSDHNKTDNIYQIGKSQIEFFAADDDSKLRGARRDILFINEANNIRKAAFDQLEPRTRQTTFIDFNPTHHFYAHDLIGTPGVEFIKSTYRDNLDNIPEKTVRSIEQRKERDPNWWRVYGEGEIGMTEGLVFNNWTQVDKMPEGLQTWCGLDFGYTNDPSALVRVGVLNDDLYIDELLYRTGMNNNDLARFIQQVTEKGEQIYADSAEPKSIDEIYAYGINIYPVQKGKDSIKNGIDVMNRYNLKVTKRSVNMIKELRNYSWMQDKEGNLMSTPIDSYNHIIDGTRYACYSQLRKKLDNSWVV